ncbi:MAG: DNA polymerase III subunit epsilon, partial [Rhodoferax sp.]|nr:DNA polymerase III subunit epsilon [Rhodoferax sp.]
MTDPQLSLEFDNGEPPRAAAPKAKPRAKPKAATKPIPAAPMSVPDMAALVAAHSDYRVLRRLQPVHHFARVAQGPVTRVVVLDTETTGLNHATDKIIELALLRVDVDTATGLPVGEVSVYDGLEDPGRPVSAEIQAITGISTDMVKGKHLDEALIATLLSNVDLVIAHNAAFD